jgi:hypothetical protein
MDILTTLVAAPFNILNMEGDEVYEEEKSWKIYLFNYFNPFDNSRNTYYSIKNSTNVSTMWFVSAMLTGAVLTFDS